MKKISIIILIIFLSITVSVIYGILHDFITSGISPEFYTKYTFFNFGILDDYSRPFNGNWVFALIWVGFFSTWWFGFFAGLILAILGLKYNDLKLILNVTLKSIMVIIGITLLFGVFGYVIAVLNPSEIIENNNFPFEIENKINFNKVRKIHNFSYLGGFFGLMIGTFNQIKNKW